LISGDDKKLLTPACGCQCVVLTRGVDVTVGLLRIDTDLKLVGYINLGITRLSFCIRESYQRGY